MSSFTWWFLNLGIAFVWLALAVRNENWFFALGTVIFIIIAFLVDLPETSSTEQRDEDDDSFLD
jgi:uncharacterized ion transporter superfamily protein YfcC